MNKQRDKGAGAGGVECGVKERGGGKCTNEVGEYRKDITTKRNQQRRGRALSSGEREDSIVSKGGGSPWTLWTGYAQKTE